MYISSHINLFFLYLSINYKLNKMKRNLFYVVVVAVSLFSCSGNDDTATVVTPEENRLMLVVTEAQPNTLHHEDIHIWKCNNLNCTNVTEIRNENNNATNSGYVNSGDRVKVQYYGNIEACLQYRLTGGEYIYLGCINSNTPHFIIEIP